MTYGSVIARPDALAPLELFRQLHDTPRSLAWVIVLGPHHERLLPRDELARIPEELDPELGVQVRFAKENVLLVTAPDPDVVLDAARAGAIEQALLRIWRGAFERTYGYDPLEHVGAVLAERLARLGFERVASGAPLAAAAWTRERDDAKHAIVVELKGSLSSPGVVPWYKAAPRHDACAASIGANWTRQRIVTCPADDGYAWPATSRDTVDASLARIADRLETDVEAWFRAGA